MPAPVWVVLPTYNEADNLAPLVAAIRVAVPDVRILVVDDSSPDGTGDVAEQLEGVAVVHHPQKTGLRRAYVAGFGHALAAGAATVIQMDADFSHDPADLPRLLERAAAGADLVLGSRYVAGGGVADWDLLRRALSYGGCGYARRVLGVSVRDLTGGLKCYRANALKAIDCSNVRSRGHAFQIEVTYRALRRGLRVQEVPIVFRRRERGSSKMSARSALEAAWLVPALRYGWRR